LALGGGGEEDILDGILTLPVSLAIRDPEFAIKFREGQLDNMAYIYTKLNAVLPEAESYLDRIASEARNEARKHARKPEKLFRLIEHTRSLSRI
jgi:hypothetical protein